MRNLVLSRSTALKYGCTGDEEIISISINEFESVLFSLHDDGIIDAVNYSNYSETLWSYELPLNEESNTVEDWFQTIYSIDENALIVLSHEGHIFSLNLEDQTGETIGFIDSGIYAAVPSPDEDFIMFLTGNSSLLLMTIEFDLISEIPIPFLSNGKNAIVVPDHGLKSQNITFPSVCWRKDSTKIAVSYFFETLEEDQKEIRSKFDIFDFSPDSSSSSSSSNNHQSSTPNENKNEGGFLKFVTCGIEYVAVDPRKEKSKKLGEHLANDEIKFHHPTSLPPSEQNTTFQVVPHTLGWSPDLSLISIVQIKNHEDWIHFVNNQEENEEGENKDSENESQPSSSSSSVIKHQNFSKTQLIFFESNGLRHGEFDLSFYSNVLQVPTWSLWCEKSNEFIMLIGYSKFSPLVESSSDVSNNQNEIQIWCRNNYHWYHKISFECSLQHVVGSKLKKLPTFVQFLPSSFEHLSTNNSEKENREFLFSAYDILIGNSCGDVMVRTISWKIDSSPTFTSNSTILVVDEGYKVKSTPICSIGIPPPMSLFEIPFFRLGDFDDDNRHLEENISMIKTCDFFTPSSSENKELIVCASSQSFTKFQFMLVDERGENYQKIPIIFNVHEEKESLQGISSQNQNFVFDFSSMLRVALEKLGKGSSSEGPGCEYSISTFYILPNGEDELLLITALSGNFEEVSQNPFEMLIVVSFTICQDRNTSMIFLSNPKLVLSDVVGSFSHPTVTICQISHFYFLKEVEELEHFQEAPVIVLQDLGGYLFYIDYSESLKECNEGKEQLVEFTDTKPNGHHALVENMNEYCYDLCFYSYFNYPSNQINMKNELILNLPIGKSLSQRLVF